MKDIEFRLATKSELVSISRISRDHIERGLGWSWTPERLKKSYLSRDTNILVATAPAARANHSGGKNKHQPPMERNRMIVGFGIMHYGTTEANLNLLAVLPEYRHKGIGRFLVQWLEKSAMTAGIDVVYLQCRQVNASAQQFYLKLGYRKLRSLPRYYSSNESAVLMGHDLLTPAPNFFLQKPY